MILAIKSFFYGDFICEVLLPHKISDDCFLAILNLRMNLEKSQCRFPFMRTHFSNTFSYVKKFHEIFRDIP